MNVHLESKEGYKVQSPLEIVPVWLVFKAMGLNEITQGRSTGGGQVRGLPEPVQYVREKKRSHQGGKKSPFF